VALFWDRNQVGMGRSLETKARVTYKQKQLDVFNDDLEEGNANDHAELGHLQLVPNRDRIEEAPKSKDTIHNVTTLYNNASQDQLIRQQQLQPLLSANENATNEINTTSTAAHNTSTSKKKQTITTIILTPALLLQSLSNTILTVLWPLLIHDRFHLSAQTFGILTFISSISSMGAMATFPLVERRVGRVKCAAGGFGVAAVFGLVFCICSFGAVGGGTDSDERLLFGTEPDTTTLLIGVKMMPYYHRIGKIVILICNNTTLSSFQ
jgi:hypothetical protein